MIKIKNFLVLNLSIFYAAPFRITWAIEKNDNHHQAPTAIYRADSVQLHWVT